ncbi:DNA-directed DNA polymerase [Tanacetum coccineum]
MSIQLVDRPIKYPVGVCENLLVKVRKFIFPVDFVVLEMDEDELVPIILGRPFLTTARVVIDIHEGKLSLRVEKEEGEDSNKALAVSFYPRTEPMEPLEWKALEDQLKPSSVEPPKLELKELSEHLEAIDWSIVDIKGIDSSFYTYKILIEDEFKPSFQPQRRVNPNIKEKGGMTVVKNEYDELIPQRTVTGWRVCIHYRKLNNATRKDHFPLPFIDQMLKLLVGHEYYFFLDGFSGYFQISIAPEDQEKTTFTCPTGPSHTNECPLDYAMLQPLFNAA